MKNILNIAIASAVALALIASPVDSYSQERRSSGSRSTTTRPQQGVLVLPLQEALVLPCPEAPRTTAAGVVPACRGVLRTTAADLPRAFHAVRRTITEEVAALL